MQSKQPLTPAPWSHCATKCRGFLSPSDGETGVWTFFCIRHRSMRAGGAHSPGGRFENSPAFQGWDPVEKDSSPIGTAEPQKSLCRSFRKSTVSQFLGLGGRFQKWQAKAPCFHRVNRPFGTRARPTRVPALKGWAILRSPSGRRGKVAEPRRHAQREL